MTGFRTSGSGRPDIFGCSAGHDTDSGQYSRVLVGVKQISLGTDLYRTSYRDAA